MQGQLEKAQQSYLAAFNRGGKKNLQVVIGYAGILRGLRKSQEALQILRAFSPNPREEKTYLANLADLLLELKEYFEARDTLKKLVESHPTNLEFSHFLGSKLQ